MYAIEAKGLSKTFDGTHYALKDIHFAIPQGEIFGFLGPNGSGKTTTVRLLNGILEPTSGMTSVFGTQTDQDPLRIHAMSGVLTESAQSYENMTGLENLEMFGKIYGLTKKEIRQRVDELLIRLDLASAKDKKVRTYSTGMKKRLSLARTLVHKPRILFLDEPTSGLDPEAALNVTRLIKELAVEQGVTVFLCTHQLKYAEEICTLYGFIHNGKMLGFGRFEELLSQKNNKTYLEIRGSGIPELKGAEVLLDGNLRLQVESDEEVSNILSHILAKGGKIYEARQQKWNLEDLYFSFSKEE